MAKSAKRLILVTGATGQQGGAVLRHLRDRGFSVRALTRDPAKPAARALVGHGTEVVQGDMNDPASLARALDGAYGVFSVQTPADKGAETEAREGINVADAAKRAGVSHIIYSSVSEGLHTIGIPSFESKARIEEHIRNSGLRYTIIRPVWFMENLLHMKSSLEQGTLALPLNPDTRLQLITVDDIGGLTALAFERAGHWQGRAVDLAGDELSMSELAQAFTRFTGREVAYTQVPWDQFEQKAGPDFTRMYRWFQDVGLHYDISAIRQEYPNLTTFERWLQKEWRAATNVMTQRG
jgi:uncharacterized protein YbjT (DUF2867 family)